MSEYRLHGVHKKLRLISACGSSSTPAATSGSSSATSGLGTPGTYSCIQGSITASGSTALQPLVSDVAKKYEAKCSGASITVNLGGSGTGLANAENGSSDIGNSDIFAKTGQEDLVDHQVAVVVFNIIVNSKVTGITNLTTAQLKAIYSGQTKNWKELGGADLPIVVVSRPTSSGTRATFQKYVLSVNVLDGVNADEVRPVWVSSGDEKSLLLSTTRSYVIGEIGSVASVQSNAGVLSLVVEPSAGVNRVGAAGPVVSTFQLNDAAGPVLPLASTACTWKV